MAPVLQGNNILNLRTKKFKDSYYRKRDHIADDYELIYKAPMDFTIAACKHVASSSLAIVTCCMAYKYLAGIEIIDMSAEITLGYGPLMSTGSELVIFAACFFLFNATILYACSKYPLRIYKKKNR